MIWEVVKKKTNSSATNDTKKALAKVSFSSRRKKTTHSMYL